MKRLVADAGLSGRIAVESAGTSRYHIGEPSDARSREAARRRGFEMNSRARQFVLKDFERFDYVIAMDGENLADLKALATPQGLDKLSLLRSFDPTSPPRASVPDPYFGGENGFETVLDICEAACTALLSRLRSEHRL
jgi:protein-tyrosine phosphatase